MGSDIGSVLAESIVKTDAITWAATITAILYVLLALKESVWCWSFGIVSSGLSVGVYFYESLWYESLLSIFYVILGVYGWIQWTKEKKDHELTGLVLGVQTETHAKPAIKIGKIPSNELLITSAIAVVAGLIMGFLSAQYTDNKFAYSDALLTSFSVIATWMTARKYIENWIFWIVIDACSAVLYICKGPSMYLFALLFIFYTFMAVAGYYTWRKSLKA